MYANFSKFVVMYVIHNNISRRLVVQLNKNEFKMWNACVNGIYAWDEPEISSIYCTFTHLRVDLLIRFSIQRQLVWITYGSSAMHTIEWTSDVENWRASSLLDNFQDGKNTTWTTTYYFIYEIITHWRILIDARRNKLKWENPYRRCNNIYLSKFLLSEFSNSFRWF